MKQGTKQKVCLKMRCVSLCPSPTHLRYVSECPDASNGGDPNRNSYSSTPRLQISTLASCSCPATERGMGEEGARGEGGKIESSIGERGR